MKKLVLTLTTLMLLSTASMSQEIGARFGDILGNDVAIDGIFSLGEFSRIHANVSFGEDFAVEAMWDFVYRPLGGEENLYWYAGAGPSLVLSDPAFLGASGEIGMEYRFLDAPIAMGIDWRPTLFIVEETDFETKHWGISIRYTFRN